MGRLNIYLHLFVDSDDKCRHKHTSPMDPMGSLKSCSNNNQWEASLPTDPRCISFQLKQQFVRKPEVFLVFLFSRKLLVEPPHLNTMRKSNWIISPGIRGQLSGLKFQGIHGTLKLTASGNPWKWRPKLAHFWKGDRHSSFRIHFFCCDLLVSLGGYQRVGPMWWVSWIMLNSWIPFCWYQCWKIDTKFPWVFHKKHISTICMQNFSGMGKNALASKGDFEWNSLIFEINGRTSLVP